MKADEIGEYLEQGIEAAKNGNKSQAREALLIVVDADPENESAWLWLSSLVDTADEKRICLENVLVINPENSAAKRGLERLGSIASSEDNPSEQIVVQHFAPVSPAASILYPDHHVKKWRWREPALNQRETNVAYKGQSAYQDVWERESEICPYCAFELGYDDWRCSKCRRNLEHSSYKYPKASSDLIIYSVLVLGVAQLSFLLIMMNLVVAESLLSLIWQSIIFISLVGLAAGIYFRRFWSYVGSIVALIMILISILLTIFVLPEAPSTLDMALAGDFFKALGDNPYVFAVGPFIDLVIPLQLAAVILALFYAIFRVGPDFERVTSRQVGQIDKGVSGSSMFYSHGKHYASQQMWASAILHFRRAAALEPSQPIYLRALGDGYARLGFYERSLDVLESAYQLEHDPGKRDQLTAVINNIRKQLEDGQFGEDERGQAIVHGE